MMLAEQLEFAHFGRVETVADRLKEAMADAGLGGRGGLTRLSEQTKLTKGAISRILREPNKAPEVETLRKLSEVLGVRFDWLANGKVPKRDKPTLELVKDEQYANRPLAAEFARRSGLPEEAVQKVLDMPGFKGAEGWTPEDWFDEMRGEARKMRTGERVADELDEPPPGGSRGR